MLALAIFAMRLVGDFQGTVFISGDDIWFQPIVQNMAGDRGLAHPFLSPIDGNLDGSLIWHGWLMPLVTGKLQGFLMPGGGVEHAKLAGNLIAASVFGAFTLFFKLRFGNGKALLVIPVFLGLFQYQVGRPEIVASVALLLFLIGIDTKILARRVFIIPFSVAIAAVSSPVLGVYLLLFGVFVLFSSSLEHSTRWKIVALQVVAIPALILLFTTAFTDLGFWRWVSGIFEHSRFISGRRDGLLAHYYLINFRLPLFVLFVFLCVIWLAQAVLYNKNIIAQSSLLVLAVLVFYTSLRVPPLVYNIAWLVPLILYFIFSGLNGRADPLLRTKSGLVAVFSAGYVLSTLFFAYLTAINIIQGQPAGMVRGAIFSLPADATIYIDKYNWSAQALFDPQDMARFVDAPQAADYILEFQAVRGGARPVVGADKCLVMSNFHDSPMNVIGLDIWYSRRDWAFAILKNQNC